MELAWKGDHFEVLKDGDYEFVHEADSVVMMPRIEGEVIVRLEPCPPYQVKGDSKYYWTPVCGTMEGGERVLETLRREMGEETPIRPNKIRIFKQMRNVPFNKLTTCRASFFFFDVLEHEITDAPGDGSDHEDKSRHVFLEESELSEITKRDNVDLPLKFCSEVLENI